MLKIRDNTYQAGLQCKLEIVSAMPLGQCMNKVDIELVSYDDNKDG